MPGIDLRRTPTDAAEAEGVDILPRSRTEHFTRSTNEETNEPIVNQPFIIGRIWSFGSYVVMLCCVHAARERLPRTRIIAERTPHLPSITFQIVLLPGKSSSSNPEAPSIRCMHAPSARRGVERLFALRCDQNFVSALRRQTWTLNPPLHESALIVY